MKSNNINQAAKILATGYEKPQKAKADKALKNPILDENYFEQNKNKK